MAPPPEVTGEEPDDPPAGPPPANPDTAAIAAYAELLATGQPDRPTILLDWD